MYFDLLKLINDINTLQYRSTGLHAAVDSDTDGGVTATRCELFTCSTVLEEELCTTTALTVVGNVSMAASFTAIVGTVQWSSHLRSSLVLSRRTLCDYMTISILCQIPAKSDMVDSSQDHTN